MWVPASFISAAEQHFAHKFRCFVFPTGYIHEPWTEKRLNIVSSWATRTAIHLWKKSNFSVSSSIKWELRKVCVSDIYYFQSQVLDCSWLLLSFWKFPHALVWNECYAAIRELEIPAFNVQSWTMLYQLLRVNIFLWIRSSHFWNPRFPGFQGVEITILTMVWNHCTMWNTRGNHIKLWISHSTMVFFVRASLEWGAELMAFGREMLIMHNRYSVKMCMMYILNILVLILCLIDNIDLYRTRGWRWWFPILGMWT